VQPSVTEANTTEAVVTNSTTETTLAEKSTTEVSKEGKVITVKNPDVDLHFTKGETGNGTGKYVNFKVEYKNVKIPDNVAVNEGDEIVFNMPKEVSFRTDFDFDVKNNLNETVGHAQASVEKGTVTTTFNDYFSKHPLNKEIAMIFDAKWTEAVTSGEITHPNFDGTVKEVHVDPEPELDPGKEKFSKWGSQDSSDAQVLNWTLRFNLAKDKLENIILQDRWSANQEYVPNSLELRTVEDVKTWTGDVSAQEYLDSFHVLNNGFDLKIKTLQKLMYINYKTRLKSSVKESTDPINAVWLAANNDNKLADNYRATISLVGGKGKAIGEAEDIPTPTPEPLKPTPTPETDGEKPKETPKEEEKPKNEIPKETPKEEKPKNEIPKETSNPKETPKETPKPDNKPKETPKEVDKPKENPKSNDKPKEEEKSKETPKVVTEENKKQASKNTLPNTGTESNSILAILGMIFFMLGIKLKRNEN
jgi:lpxtg cell wall surface protein, collagen binding domain protein